MIVSVAELMVLIDTALGSVGIADNGRYFKFPAQTRKEIALDVLNRMQGIEVEVGSKPAAEAQPKEESQP